MIVTGTTRSATRPMKFTLFGHFGSPNSGNESTLIAILARLRAFFPESEFLCICSDPAVVVARDGIEAVSTTTRAGEIWNRERPLARRMPMAFVGAVAELRQYAR